MIPLCRLISWHFSVNFLDKNDLFELLNDEWPTSQEIIKFLGSFDSEQRSLSSTRYNTHMVLSPPLPSSFLFFLFFLEGIERYCVT